MMTIINKNICPPHTFAQTIFFGTILHYPHSECVELLLDHSVDPNTVAKDESKSTALHIAAQNGDAKLVKLLLLYKANVDAQLAAGSTPLTLAAQDGALDVVEQLLDARASVDPKGGQHISALYIAAQHKHAEVMESLLAAGADPVRVAKQTKHSPLSAIMTVWKDFATLQKILEIEPDLVDKQINEGETPLEHAVFAAIDAEKGSNDDQFWRKVISLLLQLKAKPNAVIQYVPRGIGHVITGPRVDDTI